MWVDATFLEWLSNWNCCWRSYICCEMDLPFYPVDSQSNSQGYSWGLTCSYSVLTFLSMWSLIRLSDLLLVHQIPVKLNFWLTFWCLWTSGSSVSVSCNICWFWSLLIYQDPYFSRRYPMSAYSSVDGLHPGPLRVCLLTACRALSKPFLYCSGPSFSVLDNCFSFQNTN